MLGDVSEPAGARPLVGLLGDIGHTMRHAPRADSPFGNGIMLSWQLPSVA